MKLIDYVVQTKNISFDKAKRIIMAGEVLVNSEEICTPYISVNSQKDIIFFREKKKWVSRGAYKLIYGLEQFKINPANYVCIDIGSSTGGFTEVLLSFNASKIYAVDSGSNQLEYKLRINKNVIVMEKTNLKNLRKNMFNEDINLIVADVSFISLKHVFIVARNIINNTGKLLVLIKPEFEAPWSLVKSGGYVEEKFHQQIIKDLILFAKEKKFKNYGVIKSPVLGKKSKNIEYLAFFKPF